MHDLGRDVSKKAEINTGGQPQSWLEESPPPFRGGVEAVGRQNCRASSASADVSPPAREVFSSAA